MIADILINTYLYKPYLQITGGLDKGKWMNESILGFTDSSKILWFCDNIILITVTAILYKNHGADYELLNYQAGFLNY